MLPGVGLRGQHVGLLRARGIALSDSKDWAFPGDLKTTLVMQGIMKEGRRTGGDRRGCPRSRNDSALAASQEICRT